MMKNTDLSDLELATNGLRDCAFMARNLRPRSKRALDYIERFANERLERIGVETSKTVQTVTLISKTARAT